MIKSQIQLIHSKEYPVHDLLTESTMMTYAKIKNKTVLIQCVPL